jgi:hypothetical protein
MYGSVRYGRYRYAVGETPESLTYVASGSIALSGIATHTYSLDATGTSSIHFSGAAIPVEVYHYLYTVSGGLAFSGIATHAYSLATSGSGSIALSGIATHTYSLDVTGTSGIHFSGYGISHRDWMTRPAEVTDGTTRVDNGADSATRVDNGSSDAVRVRHD